MPWILNKMTFGFLLFAKAVLHSALEKIPDLNTRIDNDIQTNINNSINTSINNSTQTATNTNIPNDINNSITKSFNNTNQNTRIDDCTETSTEPTREFLPSSHYYLGSLSWASSTFYFPDSRDLLEVLRDFLGRERGGGP